MINTVTFPGLGLEFELNRVAFSIFGHNIYWYGVIIAVGFLLAVCYGLWRAPRFAMDPDVITTFVFKDLMKSLSIFLRFFLIRIQSIVHVLTMKNIS